MNDYGKKLLQAESDATKIVEELNRLKILADGYLNAKEMIQNIDPLVNKLHAISNAQLGQIKTMDKLGFPEFKEDLNQGFKRVSRQFYIVYALLGVIAIGVILSLLR